MKTLTLIMIMVVISGCAPQRDDSRMRVRVTAKSVPDTSTLFLVGEGASLGSRNPKEIPLEWKQEGYRDAEIEVRTGAHVAFRITRGSTRTEALGDRGPQYVPIYEADILRDTTLILECARWMDRDGGVTQISATDIPRSGEFFLGNGWRYHPGDDSRWSSRNWNDSTWEIAASRLDPNDLPSSGWQGIGWFRLHLEVDSSLWIVPLAFNLQHAGATEIYLDGNAIYRFGETPPSAENAIAAGLSQNPGLISFSATRSHVIAVRHSCTPVPSLSRHRFSPGFRLSLASLPQAIAYARSMDVQLTAFTMILAAFAFLHLVLFVFYPPHKENLFYALSMINVGALWYANRSALFAIDVQDLIMYGSIAQAAQIGAMLFGLLLANAFSFARFPRRIAVYLAIGVVLAVWGVYYPERIFLISKDVFTIWMLVEILLAFRRAPKKLFGSGPILTLGFVVLAITIFYEILVGNRMIAPIPGRRDLYIYGVISLGIAMSVSLSRRFASTTRELKVQLEQVQSLSEKTLAQERRARESEIERRILEADNARKTKELEDARALQLSMLPATVPTLPGLDIAVSMKTATEVGGDYYDFIVSPEGALTVAIGDATGHGAKAGMMVVITKSLFHGFAHMTGLPAILEVCSTSIKEMNLPSLYMGLQLVRFDGSRVTISSAGMPFPLLYKSRSRTVEPIVLKGMPLGSPLRFPYADDRVELSPGDTLVLMSDGLPEMFNPRGEILGNERIRQVLVDSCSGNPGEVIEALHSLGEQWADGRAQEDDMTFVVVRFT